MAMRDKAKAPATGCKSAPKVSTAKAKPKAKRGKVEVMRSALSC